LAIAADRRVDEDKRATAAHQLDWIDRRALPSALTIISFDTQIDGVHRTQAALRLSQLSPETGRRALETLVTDHAVSGPDRLEAACHLVILNSGKASAALASLSSERDLSDARRLHAALESGESDPLAALAADTDLGGMFRVRAAFELAALDRSRGIDALASLSEDPTTDNVREELARAETLRVNQERIKFFRDPFSYKQIENPPEADLGRILSYRVQAARLLNHYDHAAAIDRLTALADEPDEGVATQAATALEAVARPP